MSDETIEVSEKNGDGPTKVTRRGSEERESKAKESMGAGLCRTLSD